MIFGVCSNKPIDFEKKYLCGFQGQDSIQSQCFNTAGFVFVPEKFNGGQTRHSGLWHDSETERWFLFQGHVFNEKQLREEYRLVGSMPFSQVVSSLFSQNGAEIFRKFNGHFVVVIYDVKENQLTLVRDHFGVEPLYYYLDQDSIIFCSQPLFLLEHGIIPKQLNYKGLFTYFLFNYSPLKDTIISNLFKLRPAHSLLWRDGKTEMERYWYLSFQQEEEKDESYYVENILYLLRDAISIRLDEGRPGAFLSGGMDSSSVVGLASPMLNQKLNTFSFRCKGESFDESHYAQFMSDFYATQHHLVEFPPEATKSIVELTEIMPEPFCDIGIEIASYLLAQQAHEFVDYILSGDGGDELFAGHPAYVADRVAKFFDYIPRFVQRPIIHGLQWLPDTDKKKSLVVKAKRFSYSFNFPATLYSNRWRIYYTRSELQNALRPDFWAQLQNEDPLSEIEQYYHEADGPDFLSKALYGDYATVVSFYLTRMGVLRHFGIEARFPMFDYRLVEFAATIPSHLKIKKNSETKYILHKTMTGILPDEIVFRKDKLGHSVPMKNWIRESSIVRELILDTLSESNIKRRGYFDYNFIQKLIDEHLRKVHNHSHRLWGLTVLELWLQKNKI